MSEIDALIPDWSKYNEEEIIELNSKFIKGEINSAPYHHGPIDHEATKNLIRLGEEFRILTTEGQKTIYDKQEEYYQKAYLSFLIEEQRSKSIIDYLLARDYLVWSAKNSEPEKVTFHTKFEKIEKFVNYCVTKYLNKETGEFREYTNMGMPNIAFRDKFRDWVIIDVCTQDPFDFVPIEDVIIGWCYREQFQN